MKSMIKNETGPPGATINADNDYAPLGDLMISRPDALSQRGFGRYANDPLSALRGSLRKPTGTGSG